MWELAQSYRETIRELKQRGNELEARMDNMPPGVARDMIATRWHVIQQELRELRQAVGEMEDYLAARGLMEPRRRRRGRTGLGMKKRKGTVKSA